MYTLFPSAPAQHHRAVVTPMRASRQARCMLGKGRRTARQKVELTNDDSDSLIERPPRCYLYVLAQFLTTNNSLGPAGSLCVLQYRSVRSWCEGASKPFSRSWEETYCIPVIV